MPAEKQGRHTAGLKLGELTFADPWDTGASVLPGPGCTVQSLAVPLVGNFEIKLIRQVVELVNWEDRNHNGSMLGVEPVPELG
eukprot:6971026-Ditylum_brightwellii.AAC.1